MRALRHHTDLGSLASDLGLGELQRARSLQRLGNDAEAFAAASAPARQMREHLRVDADNSETVNDTAICQYHEKYHIEIFSWQAER